MVGLKRRYETKAKEIDKINLIFSKDREKRYIYLFHKITREIFEYSIKDLFINTKFGYDGEYEIFIVADPKMKGPVCRQAHYALSDIGFIFCEMELTREHVRQIIKGVVV